MDFIWTFLGCPSALFDIESVDWAPTVKLGYQRTKPKSLLREQRTKLKEDHQRCAETMSDLQQTAERPSISLGGPGSEPTTPQSEAITGNDTLNNQGNLLRCVTSIIISKYYNLYSNFKLVLQNRL